MVDGSGEQWRDLRCCFVGDADKPECLDAGVIEDKKHQGKLSGSWPEQTGLCSVSVVGSDVQNDFALRSSDFYLVDSSSFFQVSLSLSSDGPQSSFLPNLHILPKQAHLLEVSTTT